MSRLRPLKEPQWTGNTSVAAGRADLLRAFIAGGEELLAQTARLLGYEETKRAPETFEEREPLTAPERRFSRKVTVGTQLAPVPFLRVESVEHMAPEPAPVRRAVEPIGVDGVGRSEGAPPRPLPLVAEARLSAALRRRLFSDVPSRRVDVPRLVERWSRGGIAREVPRLRLAAWSRRVTVLVDRSSHLIPFWEDQDRLLGQLYRLLGRPAVCEVRLDLGAGSLWRSGQDGYVLAAGTPVLALSDLGYLADPSSKDYWSDLGSRLRRTGSTLSALVPCPADRWSGLAWRTWRAMVWERPERAPAGGRGHGPAERRARAERLLGLLAFATRIEPGLLRAVRRLLPADEADAGTESDAWNHPEMSGGFAPAASLLPDLRARLRESWYREDSTLQQGVVGLLRAWRSGAPREIWLDEVVALDAAAKLPLGTLRPEEVEEAETLWQRIGETLENPMPTRPLVARALEGFVGRAIGDRLPLAAWDDSRWRPLLARAWVGAWRGEGNPPVPATVGSGVLNLPRGEPRRWQAWQVGSSLHWATSGSPLGSGSPLVEVESSDNAVALVEERARWSIPRPLGEPLPLPKSSTLLLLTDRTRATLRRVNRPEWASALGRDRFGLWATLEIDGVEQRMRWIPPGRFWMGSPEDEPGRWPDEGPRHLEVIEQGFWLGETPCTQALWQAVMGENPSQFHSPDRPVEQVSWEDCQEFLGRLGKEDADGERWRLPGEAEWEYACRAGTETATYAGPIEIVEDFKAPILDNIAWYGGNSGEERDRVDDEEGPSDQAGTHPVARKDPNPWGLYDTLGNVFEWCEDLWRGNYDADPRGMDRVRRGGSWFSSARFCRAAYRSWNDPSVRWNDLGFRLARGQSALQSGAEPGGAERPDRGVARRGTRPPASGPRKI